MNDTLEPEKFGLIISKDKKKQHENETIKVCFAIFMFHSVMMMDDFRVQPKINLNNVSLFHMNHSKITKCNQKAWI